jgi:hypothetical protein
MSMGDETDGAGAGARAGAVENLEDESDERVLYHSLNPQLSIQLFFEQIISHLFFPLPLPYFLWKYGQTFPMAHGFNSISFFPILSNWIFPSFFVLTIITSRYLPGQISDGFIVPVCIFLIHRFMVATKYATLSESEYAYDLCLPLSSLIVCRDYLDLNRPGGIYSPPHPNYKTIHASHQAQLQILQSWAHLTPETIAYELHAAAKKLEIDLEHVLFYVPIPIAQKSNMTSPNSTEFVSTQYQFDLWKLFLQEDELESRYPHLTIPSSTASSSHDYICISGFKVCQSILNHCNHAFSSPIICLNLLTSLAFASIPILFIFLFPSLYSSDAITPPLLPFYILFHISCFFLNSVLFHLLVAILLVCIVDAYRKLQIFTFLSALIRANDVDMDLMHITSTLTPLPPPRDFAPTGSSSRPHLPSGRKLGERNKIQPTDQVSLPIKTRRRKTSILLPNRSVMSPLPHLQPQPQGLDQVQFIGGKEESPSNGPGDGGREGTEREGEDLLEEDSKGLVSSTTAVAWTPPPHQQQISQLSSKRLNYKFKAYEGNGSRSVIPRLDFEVRYNIFSWSSVRLVFHNFGSRMKFRIDCYLGHLPSPLLS